MTAHGSTCFALQFIIRNFLPANYSLLVGPTWLNFFMWFNLNLMAESSTKKKESNLQKPPMPNWIFMTFRFSAYRSIKTFPWSYAVWSYTFCMHAVYCGSEYARCILHLKSRSVDDIAIPVRHDWCLFGEMHLHFFGLDWDIWAAKTKDASKWYLKQTRNPTWFSY